MKISRNQLIIIGLAITLQLLTSCEKSIIGIKGEGPIVTKDINLSEIEGVNLAASGTVYITHSENQQITIKSHQSIIDNMEWDVNSKVLDIDFTKNVRDYETLDIYISLNLLKSINISGSGDVKTTSIFNSDDSFSAKVSGSGNLSMDINSPKIELTTSGSGDIKLYSSTTLLLAKISGTGDYKLSGSAVSTIYTISGSGDISAYSLSSENSDINISGSGDVDLLVSENLKVNISGSGDVNYKGWPKIDMNISGSGHVRSSN